MEETTTNIHRVVLKNFLGISEIEVHPGKVTQITGKNGAGKTTILKAIEWAVKGGADGSLVKNGQEQAEVLVELADETTIRRRLTADGRQSVDVRRGEFKVTAAQTYLDQLFADSSFNPMELLEPKRRHDAIMAAIDLKVSALNVAKELGVEVDRLPAVDWGKHGLEVLEALRTFYYQRRAEANREAADAKKKWEVNFAELPGEIAVPNMSRAELDSQLKKIDTELIRIEVELNGIAEAQAVRAKKLERIEKYENTLRGIRDEIKVLKARETECERFLEEEKNALPSADSIPDRTKLVERAEEAKRRREEAKVAQAKWGEVEQVEKVRKMVSAMEKDYNAKQAIAKAFTEKVEVLSGPLQSKLMAAAEMPIAGLEYRDGKFLVEGVQVDNLSTAKAMLLAVGIARKLSKTSKVIVIDGVEALDKETFEAFRKEIAGDGFTYVLTKVGEPFAAKGEDVVINMDEGKVLQ
jgi:energy-coupling factor transporter ATP-binding protein EcfA2